MAVIALIFLVAALCVWTVRAPRAHGAPLFAGTRRRFRRHLSRRNALRLAVVLLGTTVLAYSGIDERFDAWHRRRVTSARSNRVADVLHFFGERIWVLTWAVFAAVDASLRGTPLSRLGRSAFDALVVGLPSLWIVQRLLGASRPSEGRGPRYRPFADDNSASGHTFVAAVPWLVLARRVRHPAWRALALVASPLTGWSRINDGKHYLSQVVLGYALAWGAVETATLDADEAPAATVDSG